MIYHAVLFDMDGVITETEQAVTAFWHKLAARHGVTLTQEDFDRHIYGCQTPYTLGVLFPHLGPEDHAAILREEEETEINAHYPAMPGVLEFLRALKAQNIPTALVTSGKQWKAQAVIDQLALADLLTVQVTAELIHHSKPHPEGYLLAAHLLNVLPERCIVFEDAPSGVQAAVASSALCVGVRPTRTAALLRGVGAAHVVPNFMAVRLANGELRLNDNTRIQLGTH